MKRSSGFALLLATAIVLPCGVAAAFEHPGADAGSNPQWIVRGGGGGGRGGGGSRGGGSRGGGSRSSGGPSRSGFSNAGSSLNRGNTRPSGGWSNQVRSPQVNPSINHASGNRAVTRPSTGIGPSDRPVGGTDRGTRNLSGSRDLGATRDMSGTRDLNRNTTRDFNRDVNRDVNRSIDRNVNVDWNRRVDIGDVNLNPGWARPGWGVARPWNYGWYGGWGTPAWGWWGARAAAWGVGTLATATIINSAVDDAVSSAETYIVVPNTTYQLLYGTVQPSGSSGVSFAVTADGSTYQLTADCNAGLIDGREPQSAAEAELLNAACQVAYGAA